MEYQVSTSSITAAPGWTMLYLKVQWWCMGYQVGTAMVYQGLLEGPMLVYRVSK